MRVKNSLKAQGRGTAQQIRWAGIHSLGDESLQELHWTTGTSFKISSQLNFLLFVQRTRSTQSLRQLQRRKSISYGITQPSGKTHQTKAANTCGFHIKPARIRDSTDSSLYSTRERWERPEIEPITSVSGEEDEEEEESLVKELRQLSSTRSS